MAIYSCIQITARSTELGEGVKDWKAQVLVNVGHFVLGEAGCNSLKEMHLVSNEF